ncbi:MAG TPA: VOC family protein [Myxococcaceae bacterium]|nr:VOC family protein [Myxococcaceae bacterium]
MRSAPVLRVARPTDQLQALLPFYVDGLGLEVLASFADHQGFDGAILGMPGAPYHLELTHQRGETVGPAPSREHLLVFYLPEPEEWTRAVRRMESAGFPRVPSLNPYWDRCGVTFQDPDGYRVVLVSAAWAG